VSKDKNRMYDGTKESDWEYYRIPGSNILGRKRKAGSMKDVPSRFHLEPVVVKEKSFALTREQQRLLSERHRFERVLKCKGLDKNTIALIKKGLEANQARMSAESEKRK